MTDQPLPITLSKDESNTVWLHFIGDKGQSAVLNLNNVVAAGRVGFTQNVMFRAIEQFPIMKPALPTAKVRDGTITKGDMVWWRSENSPEFVCSTSQNHWESILKYGETHYQVAQPKTRLVYED